MPLRLDRDFTIVICDHKDGPFIPEVQDLGRACAEMVRRDIADCQYTDVLAVIEFNPKEFTAREVTHDYEQTIADARALLERCRSRGPDID
jgi:hypothetical protein